ncbi:hypothetical protein OA07_03865 [Aphanizomenon flos-aquae 2012/KM1/D3]|nr:hypothetical protein OA07_03865 [Aphanizomenon flos-aquae 2012/KM1/D3]
MIAVSNVLPLPNPPLIKGRELDFYCFPPLQAIVYTQVKLPPPMLWGETGKISSLPKASGRVRVG